jgi:hypothetical protein
VLKKLESSLKLALAKPLAGKIIANIRTTDTIRKIMAPNNFSAEISDSTAICYISSLEPGLLSK